MSCHSLWLSCGQGDRRFVNNRRRVGAVLFYDHSRELMFFNYQLAVIDYLGDPANKTIATPRNGLDVIMTVDAQSLPEHRYVLREISFLDERVRPNLFHQSTFFYDVPAVLNQYQQQAKDLLG